MERNKGTNTLWRERHQQVDANNHEAIEKLAITQRKGSGIEDLILLPWWVSLVFAGMGLHW